MKFSNWNPDMKITGSIICFFQILLSYGQADQAFTEMGDIAKFKSEISISAGNTETVQASFIQEKHLGMLKDNLISEGTLQFKKPNMIKWGYTKPYDYVVVLNDQKVVISDEGNVNTMDLSASASFSELSTIMSSVISGNVMDGKRFEIEYLESDAQYLVELHPKDAQMKSRIALIEMYIAKDDYSVDAIKLIEPANDYTLISFSNIRLNAPLSDAIFDMD